MTTSYEVKTRKNKKNKLLWLIIQHLVSCCYKLFSVKLLPTTAFTRFQNKLQELRKAGFYRENQLDYPGIHHFGILLPKWGDILSEGDPSNKNVSPWKSPKINEYRDWSPKIATDQLAVLRPLLAIFCQLHSKLLQNWSSDSPFRC